MNFASSGIDAALGRVIRALRTEAGMTQSDMGQAIGVSFQQMQKYESGLNRVSVSRLMRIALVLGIPASAILARLESEEDEAPRATGT